MQAKVTGEVAGEVTYTLAFTIDGTTYRFKVDEENFLRAMDKNKVADQAYAQGYSDAMEDYGISRS